MTQARPGSTARPSQTLKPNLPSSPHRALVRTFTFQHFSNRPFDMDLPEAHLSIEINSSLHLAAHTPPPPSPLSNPPGEHSVIFRIQLESRGASPDFAHPTRQDWHLPTLGPTMFFVCLHHGADRPPLDYKSLEDKIHALLISSSSRPGTLSKGSLNSLVDS